MKSLRKIKTKLEGKVAIVAGAGHGIGQGSVHCLAEAGTDVAIIDINGDNARIAEGGERFKKIKGAGGGATFVRAVDGGLTASCLMHLME